MVYCIEPDAGKVAAARKMLDDAGVYGVRVAVHEGGLDRLPYASYVANLIVLDERLAGDPLGRPAAELYRVLRPCGGVLCVSSSKATPAALRRWLADGGVPPNEITVADGSDNESAVSNVVGEFDRSLSNTK